MIPFMNIVLRLGQREWGATVENHFISQLEPADRIVLVSKSLEPPKNIGAGAHASSVRIRPFFRDGKELLDTLYEGYSMLRQGALEKSVELKDKGEERRPFYRRYLESEFKRLLFGGLGQEPPKPSIQVRMDRLVIDLYEKILFPQGLKPTLASYSTYAVPFSFDEDGLEFKTAYKSYTSFARILTGLIRKEKLSFKE